MRRVRFGSTTDGTLDALDAQLDTGNENGNNPDNDLVIRDSTGTIVARYNESATTWQLEQPLDLQSNNVTNVGALDTKQASIDQTGCRVHATSNFSIPGDGANTEFEIDDSRYVDSDVLSIDFPNNEIKVDVAGRWRVESQAVFLSDLGDNRHTGRILINDSLESNLRGINESGDRDAIAGSDEFDLSENDVISIDLSQESGEAVDVFGAETDSYWIVRKVA